MIATVLRPFAVLLAAVPALAQLELGGVPAEPRWSAWVQGDPVAFAAEAAPKCTVYAFYTRTGGLPAFAQQGDYLALLQRRFAERGLVVVAAVPAAPTAGQTAWQGCRIVCDEGQAVTRSWFGDDADGGHGVVALPLPIGVVDRRGVVRFLGTPAAGLVDAIEAVLDGRDTLPAERTAAALRVDLVAGFDDSTAAAAEPLAEVVQHASRDGLARGLLYLVLATKKNDGPAAAKFLQESLAALADEPLPLAAFADLALRGDPRRAGLAGFVRDALKPAAAAAPADTFVQLAWLRALVLAGDDREVGRQSMKLRKAVTATAADCLDFASILAQAGNAPVHRDLASMALDKAAALAVDLRQLAAARYVVAARCANDVETQKRLLDEYLKDTEMRVSLNNDCWYLMTELATMGRYDAFAAGLAERMLEQKDGMDYFEFDTAALAMFLCGRFGEAVTLQETALEKGGKDNPEYRERLDRYKAAAAPAPR
ncbi:MAG: hypothetical protein JNK15_10060 [Planctomycetes bacterium]|nr:hypothetical protein [Planctomycetota bacterium]